MVTLITLAVFGILALALVVLVGTYVIGHKCSKRDAIRQGLWRDEVRIAAGGGRRGPDIDGYVRY